MRYLHIIEMEKTGVPSQTQCSRRSSWTNEACADTWMKWWGEPCDSLEEETSSQRKKPLHWPGDWPMLGRQQGSRATGADWMVLGEGWQERRQESSGSLWKALKAKCLPMARGGLEPGNAVMLLMVAAVSGRMCVERERKDTRLTLWFLEEQMEVQSDLGWNGGNYRRPGVFFGGGELSFWFVSVDAKVFRWNEINLRERGQDKIGEIWRLNWETHKEVEDMM